MLLCANEFTNIAQDAIAQQAEDDASTQPAAPQAAAAQVADPSTAVQDDGGQEEQKDQDRSRALPALAAVATRLLPLATKIVPKLTSASRLTSVSVLRCTKSLFLFQPVKKARVDMYRTFRSTYFWYRSLTCQALDVLRSTGR